MSYIHLSYRAKTTFVLYLKNKLSSVQKEVTRGEVSYAIAVLLLVIKGNHGFNNLKLKLLNPLLLWIPH